jgi:hypothetical protein
MVQLRLVTCFRDSDFRADFSGLKHFMQRLRLLEELRRKTANEKGTSTRRVLAQEVMAVLDRLLILNFGCNLDLLTDF